MDVAEWEGEGFQTWGGTRCESGGAAGGGVGVPDPDVCPS